MRNFYIYKKACPTTPIDFCEAQGDTGADVIALHDVRAQSNLSEEEWKRF
jgi:hypothetical protein